MDFRYRKTRRLLNKHVNTHQKMREWLAQDFPLQKKIKLIGQLESGRDKTKDLLKIIDDQIHDLPRFFKWFKKILGVDLKLKENLAFFKHLEEGNASHTREGIARIHSATKSPKDQEIMQIVREIFNDTLTKETIANQKFQEADAEIKLEKNDLNCIKLLEQNLRKQRHLIIEIESGMKDKHPTQVRFDGNKSALEKLKRLVAEEQKFHIVLAQDEDFNTRLEKKLIDHFGEEYMLRVRKHKALAWIKGYAIIGIPLAAAAWYAYGLGKDQIQDKLPARPGFTASEVKGDIDKAIRDVHGGDWSGILRKASEQCTAKITGEIKKQKIVAIVDAELIAQKCIAEGIYEIYIKELAKKLDQYKILIRLGYDLNFFTKRKADILNSIRTTINVRYRIQIIRIIKPAVEANNPSYWQGVRNNIRIGGGRPEYVIENQQILNEKIIQAVEPLIAKILHEAIQRTTELLKTAAEEAVKRGAEEVAPEQVKPWVRPFIDLFIYHWYWLGIGYLTFGAFTSMLFRRREKKYLRELYKGGFLDGIKD